MTDQPHGNHADGEEDVMNCAACFEEAKRDPLVALILGNPIPLPRRRSGLIGQIDSKEKPR